MSPLDKPCGPSFVNLHPSLITTGESAFEDLDLRRKVLDLRLILQGKTLFNSTHQRNNLNEDQSDHE
jgi:hypothetical protein